MTYALRACLVLATLALLGCSGGHELPFSQSVEPRTIAERLRQPKPEPAVLPDLTPEWIAARTAPALEVTMERTGNVALLALLSERPGSGEGTVRIWRAADDSQIILREGVLIATRGLGNDIGSTLSRTMVTFVTSRTPLSGPHRLYVVTGENGTAPIQLSCQTVVVGDEIVTIVDRAIATLHLRAECRHATGVQNYDFWVNSKTSTVWKSRQWAGPALGYVRTRLIKE